MRVVRVLALLAVATVSLTACYVVPVTRPDGAVVYQPYPLPAPGTVIPGTATGTVPAVITAKLYPSNEVAAQTGIITGTVTNMMTGKGQFQVSYMGEILIGEATRVSNSDKRGVASAYSPKGMYMSCEYQMNTPYQGAGNCTFSNGASYQMHLGGN